MEPPAVESGRDGQALVSRHAWAVWVRSPPSWNFRILMPGLQALTVDVFPAYVLLRGRIAFVHKAMRIWLDADAAPAKDDVLTDIVAGRSRWLGSFVDLESRREDLGLVRALRGERMRLRLYLKEPEEVVQAVVDAMGL